MVVGVEKLRLDEGRGGLKGEGMGSVVLEDVDDEFVLELGLSSGTFSFLLLCAQVVKCSGCGG